MKKTRALFIGRFQPFHHGHYEAIKRLLTIHDEVIVVIGSAEESNTSNNPFTSGERIQMVRAAFDAKPLARLIIVPVRDLNDHTRWVTHVRSYVPEFDIVYSNNELVARLFKEAGYKAEGMDFIDRGTNEGKFVRSLMKRGSDDWKKHVPNGVAEFLESIDAVGRLKSIEGSSRSSK